MQKLFQSAVIPIDLSPILSWAFAQSAYLGMRHARQASVDVLQTGVSEIFPANYSQREFRELEGFLV